MQLHALHQDGRAPGLFRAGRAAGRGDTSAYRRADKPGAGAEIRFCATCGATTHFVLTADTIARVGNTVAGVNMRLADDRDLAGVELRYPDGRAWPGTGDFGYVREARVVEMPIESGGPVRRKGMRTTGLRLDHLQS